MDLNFSTELANNYRSKSQIARVLSEDWVLKNFFCPNCGSKNVRNYLNNNPAADFFCPECEEDYELKSTKSKLTKKVVDGAFETMIAKIEKKENPHFLFLQYNNDYVVQNYFSIPKHYFLPEIIERRKPLAISARRSGWVGCNILLNELPDSGKIYFIRDKKIIDKFEILSQWRKTLFLAKEKLDNRNWLVSIISIIEKIPYDIFNLNDVYKFENYLSLKFPNNNNVKPKIRQQLQVLRDYGYITFLGNGKYKKDK